MDGRSLVTLAHEFELFHDYEPAGGYAGLAPDLVGAGGMDLDRYYLGDYPPWNNGASIYLLGCQCGEYGCWPLLARVEVTADEVIWSGFEQPHRPDRDYTTLGPFTFDRRQYEQAIGEAVAALEASD